MLDMPARSLKVATRVRIPLGLLRFVALDGIRAVEVASDLLAQDLAEITQMTRVNDIAVGLSTLKDVVCEPASSVS